MDTEIDLDEQGFVFIDQADRPYWCLMLGGDPWFCYWHAEQKWVTLRRVRPAEVFAARMFEIPPEQAELYHELHRKQLGDTAV